MEEASRESFKTRLRESQRMISPSHGKHQREDNSIKRNPQSPRHTMQDMTDRCPRERTRQCRRRVGGSNRGNPWKTNSQYSAREKETKEPDKSSRALQGTGRKGMNQACREERCGMGPKFPPKIKREPEKKRKESAEAKQSKSTRVRGRILSDPPRQLNAHGIHKQW